MNAPVLTLTQALLARPSVTPADAGCLEIIGARLAAAGFRLEALPFGEVSNLWACHGQGEPVFCFAGHTDVVPPGDPAAWSSPPFEPQIRDGHLFGRGAADMKGSLAAMVVAAERFVAAHPAHPGTLAFLLTSDEEGIARDGTRRVVETLAARGTPLTWCLVGEPSSQLELGDLLRHGRRGSLNGRLLVQGVQGHVAYPERACNPIHAASDVLARLVSTTWDDGNAYFPATSFQVSNLHAGTGAENVIPATLQAWFNFRYSTASTADDLKRRVHALCDATGLNYRIDWHLSGEPFLTPRGVLVQAVTESIRACLGREPALSTGGGTSDGRFIAKTGCEVVELGPVNASIHKVDECVAVDDLEALAGVYADVLARLLRSG